ncbi:sugar transferase [Mycolicibacterium sp. P1-18]|uniref:sugar transferase n=1 Tax=Mycolicibacterium sp. P1-18 TaxID=2024615 RepID=UPI0011F2BF31|nr:sugar transferase [Mycolicibacterium sp. P1-18]KAA0098821.1 sugar transferase [Mycolicibacterium sp. P1-18]
MSAPQWIERFRSDRWYLTITVALDLLAAVGAVAAAHAWLPSTEDTRYVLVYSWLFVPLAVLVLATRSLYTRKLDFKFLEDFEPVETAVAVAALGTLTVIMVAVPQFAPGSVVGQYVRPSDLVIRIWVCAAILLPLVRLSRSQVYRYLRRKYRVGSPALILGSGPIAYQLVTRMRQVPEYGLHPVGLLDDFRPPEAETFDLPYLGTTFDLEDVARRVRAEDLIVAPSAVSDEQLARAAQVAQTLGIRVFVVPRLFDAVGVGTRVEHLGGIPLLVLARVDPKGWQFALKHGFDRTMAGIGLLLISPLFLTLALLVKITSPGPIFYRQPRIGRDSKVFDCLKFRSMRPLDPSEEGFAPKAGDAPGGVEGVDRRTKIGKFMRKTSLDELPQLLNVLKGDMSLVGPRPERPAFVELFEMQVRRYGDRHRVKAGITGWAQVHGLRGQTSIADRAEFDNYYIENWSLRLDFRILVLTVLAVFRSVEE